jgi:hypothetical protein
MNTSDLLVIVSQFIEEQLDLSSLEEWIVPHLPELLTDPDSLAAEIVAEIELGLVEISSRRMTEDKLRESLALLLNESKWFKVPEVTTSSANQIEYQIFANHNTFPISSREMMNTTA